MTEEELKALEQRCDDRSTYATLVLPCSDVRGLIAEVRMLRRQLGAELQRYREREPLVQELLAAIAESDPDDCVSTLDVAHENVGADGHTYPRMWLRLAARLARDVKVKPDTEASQEPAK